MSAQNNGPRIAYITVGNSDDKLPQSRWSLFLKDIEYLVKDYRTIEGFAGGWWMTSPDSLRQSACLALRVPNVNSVVDAFCADLVKMAEKYDQDAIVFAMIPESKVKMLGPDTEKASTWNHPFPRNRPAIETPAEGGDTNSGT